MPSSGPFQLPDFLNRFGPFRHLRGMALESNVDKEIDQLLSRTLVPPHEVVYAECGSVLQCARLQ